MKSGVLATFAVISILMGLLAAFAAVSGFLAFFGHADDVAMFVLAAVTVLFSSALAFLFIRSGAIYLKTRTPAHAIDVIVAVSFLLWFCIISVSWIPDHVKVADYMLPKPVLGVALAYAAYRIMKIFLIKNEN